MKADGFKLTSTEINLILGFSPKYPKLNHKLYCMSDIGFGDIFFQVEWFLTFESNLVHLSGQSPIGGTVGAAVVLTGDDCDRLQMN